MVMDGGDEAPGTRYVIPGNSPEKERLLKQYELKKDYYGWTEAVPDSVDLSRVSAVLDVAAGSCAWTLDLARHPAIANRLPAPGDAKGDTVRLYACDIDTRFFTDAPAEDAPDITKFQHDVTKAFPLEMQDTFDLVHMSLLALALTRTGWNSALKNILAILKPGGLLMIDDIDPTLYPEEQRPLAEDVSDASLSSCMDGEGWIPKANRIYTGWVLFSNFIPVLSVRMPRILSEVGFDLVESRRAVGCHGKLCHVIKNPNGRDMARWTDFSTENMVFVLTHLASALLEKGELRSSGEQKITTVNEMKAMLEEVRQGFMHDGAVNYGIYCLAKKLQYCHCRL